ncbi:MAG: hypothetical protein ABI422_04935 [Sphingomicrobium sp.]
MLAATLLSACGAPTETNVATNESAPAEAPAVNDATPLSPPAPGVPGGLPDDRTPLEEPRAPINYKSAEAAGQVMQSYGALIEQKRFSEAAGLWGDGAAAAAFSAQFKFASEVHAQVGKPGDTEGAAGSIYVTVPVVFYGRMKGGGEFSRSGTATLRRVNDVPGATEKQLRWHIAQIEVAGAA